MPIAGISAVAILDPGADPPQHAGVRAMWPGWCCAARDGPSAGSRPSAGEPATARASASHEEGLVLEREPAPVVARLDCQSCAAAAEQAWRDVAGPTSRRELEQRSRLPTLEVDPALAQRSACGSGRAQSTVMPRDRGL